MVCSRSLPKRNPDSQWPAKAEKKEMGRIWLALLFAICLTACRQSSSDGDIPPSSDEPPAEAEEVRPASDQPITGDSVRVIESSQTRTYGVEGRTIPALRAALNATGPFASADGRRYDSVTNWSLTWSFRFNHSSGCALANATIEISVEELLPEAASPEDLSPTVMARWQAFVDALKAHEDGHAERERAGAALLGAAFEAVPPAPDCAQLGLDLNRLGEQQKAAIRTADATWDLVTDHGRLQGAVFP